MSIIENDDTIIDLNTKVDMFIDWYYEKMVKGKHSEYGDYRLPIEMRNLIEKLAVWYELRYNDYELDRIMNSLDKEGLTLNILLDAEYVKPLRWTVFFNSQLFNKLLPWEERRFFEEPRYKDNICLKSKFREDARIYLTKEGIVRKAENIRPYTKGLIKDEDLFGRDAYGVKRLFEEKRIRLPKNNELDQTIQLEDDWYNQQEGILDCAMYRIIERGGKRMGPRRAFLFAIEFGRDIDIPMKYGIDFSDPGLIFFVNDYLNEGGSKELECYLGYFNKTTNKEDVNTITIKDVLLKQRNNTSKLYRTEGESTNSKLTNLIENKVLQKIMKDSNQERK